MFQIKSTDKNLPLSLNFEYVFHLKNLFSVILSATLEHEGLHIYLSDFFPPPGGALFYIRPYLIFSKFIPDIIRE